MMAPRIVRKKEIVNNMKTLGYNPTYNTGPNLKFVSRGRNADKITLPSILDVTNITQFTSNAKILREFGVFKRDQVVGACRSACNDFDNLVEEFGNPLSEGDSFHIDDLCNELKFVPPKQKREIVSILTGKPAEFSDDELNDLLELADFDEDTKNTIKFFVAQLEHKTPESIIETLETLNNAIPPISKEFIELLRGM